MTLEELKYPIGKYIKPESYTEQDLKGWIDVLAALPSWVDACIENMDEAQLQTPYRPGGWTVQQVVHHLADSHMNAYVRLKLALTEDNPTIKPYDENGWAALPDTQYTPVNISATLLHALHRRLIALLNHMQPEQWLRTYYHPALQRNIALWEMMALYAWHSRHHIEHIRGLRERNGWYL